jgi:hypothetical protein
LLVDSEEAAPTARPADRRSLLALNHASVFGCDMTAQHPHS